MIHPADSSYYSFTPLHSLAESIESLAQMLTESPLSYQKESYKRLFHTICEKVPKTAPCQTTLKTLESMIHYSLDIQPVNIKKTLQELKKYTN